MASEMTRHIPQLTNVINDLEYIDILAVFFNERATW